MKHIRIYEELTDSDSGEGISMEELRRAAQDYLKRSTPIAKRTGEPAKTKEVPFPGYYNIAPGDLPMNKRAFYNNFKRSLGTHGMKPSENTKAEILDALDNILTLNGFK